MENLSYIKNSVTNAKNIGILVKNDADEDAVVAASALFFALKNAHKQAVFPSVLSEKLSSIMDIHSKRQQKIHISLDEDVSEVYYEKKDNGIDVFITPKSENISDDNFSCKIISGSNEEYSDNVSDFDLLFAIGVENFEDVEHMCGQNLDQLYACTVINIDNNLSNQNYGEINIVNDKEPLCQNIACVINSLGVEFINKDVCSFLLYGLIKSHKNLYNQTSIPVIRWLIKNGGDFSAFSRFQKEKLPPQMKLLEAALKTLDFHTDANIYISTIEESAMINSGGTSKDLAFVIEKVKNFFKLPSFLLLWESHASPVTVKGIFYCDDRDTIKKISDNFKGVSKGFGTLFLTETNSISLAKEKVLSYLSK